jgi:hypothetical protein
VRLELLRNQEPAEVCADALLEEATNRSSTVHGVIGAFQNYVDTTVVKGELDVLLLEAIAESLELNANNLAQLSLAEGIEDDDVIKAVEELRGKVALDGPHNLASGDLVDLLSILEHCDVFEEVLSTKVAGHNDNDVAEVHHVTLSIGKATIVEELKEHIPDLTMRLLDLVKEEHRVRIPANGLSQLTSLFVTNITRR